MRSERGVDGKFGTSWRFPRQQLLALVRSVRSPRVLIRPFGRQVGPETASRENSAENGDSICKRKWTLHPLSGNKLRYLQKQKQEKLSWSLRKCPNYNKENPKWLLHKKPPFPTAVRSVSFILSPIQRPRSIQDVTSAAPSP